MSTRALIMGTILVGTAAVGGVGGADAGGTSEVVVGGTSSVEGGAEIGETRLTGSSGGTASRVFDLGFTRRGRSKRNDRHSKGGLRHVLIKNRNRFISQSRGNF